MCSLCLDVNVSFCPCVCLLIKTLFPKPTRITRESHRQTQKQCLPACLPAACNQTPTPPPLQTSQRGQQFFFLPSSPAGRRRKEKGQNEPRTFSYDKVTTPRIHREVSAGRRSDKSKTNVQPVAQLLT